MKLRDVMKSPVVSVPADYSIARAAEAMENSGFGFLPVEREGRLVGVVTGKDLATRAAARKLSMDSSAVEVIMSTPPICLTVDSDVEEGLVIMRQRDIRRILISNEFGQAVGVVSLADLEGKGADAAIARALEQHMGFQLNREAEQAITIPGLYLG